MVDSVAQYLSNDLDTLRQLVLSQQQLIAEQRDENERQRKENEWQRIKIASLQEQLNILLHKRYGPSSEKVPPEQLRLFNEAEQDAETPVTEPETTTVTAHTRKKPGRTALPEELPRVEIIHDLPEEERICPHDGHILVEIGREVSEQLDIIPAKVRVLRHVRIKYGCQCCHQGVTTAPMPPQPIPKSIASPGFLAHVAVAKYQDSLPLYRQEKILQRIGVEIPRATLAGMMIKTGMLIQSLINLMRDCLLAYDIIQIDETTVQVLKEPGKSPQSKSYMWVQRGGPPGKCIILFDYDPSRGGDVPTRLLEGFSGYLQTDGYEGYNAVCKQPDIVQLGCGSHCRRKFDEAVKAQGKKGKDQPAKAGKAWQGLAYFRKLYRIERQIKGQSPEERYQVRQDKAKPILDEMREWLDKSLPGVPPKTAIGKALYYLDRQWSKLIRYLDDGRLEIDNNLVENAVRPFALGRKNWLFSATVQGAKASANLYSLIETAKANGLESYAYLRFVFTELPEAETVEDIEALLPFNVDPKRLTPSDPE
ncbi:MAG: IS66 family transposase [Gammaproteobacteria bacterium]|nr:IS66 family transposase [Gammaproteobacteria bacterium]